MKEKIGIFWVIDGKVYAYQEEINEEALTERTALTGIIDSNYAHFSTWEENLASVYPEADFASFPRGRVVYDTRQGQAVVYVDECITNGEIAKICAAFHLNNVRIDYDEHYTCDQCIGDKELF